MSGRWFECLYCGLSSCECDRDDATPPLVAAPPVPPVVPDSDPFGPLSDEDRRRMREFGASGSGVVPDKPALADERARLLDASTTPVLLPATTLNPRERRAIEALMRAYVGQYALTEEDRDDLPEWVEAQS